VWQVWPLLLLLLLLRWQRWALLLQVLLLLLRNRHDRMSIPYCLLLLMIIMGSKLALLCRNGLHVSP
jgi:hypothetical protein